MAGRAFEGVKLRNGLLRELDSVRLFGVVAGGQLLMGEENATSWVFCAGGGVWVDTSPGGRWPSAVKVAGRAALRFPWRREFVPGFDD